MRSHLKLAGLLAVLITVIPLLSLLHEPPSKTADSELVETVDILFTETGEVKKIPMKNYIIGAVFAQMPARFDEEALKAQAVLAHTYALRRMEEEKLSPTEDLKGAVMSDDRDKYQAYFTPEEAKVCCRDDYAEAYRKIEAAADYATDRYLSYDGKPVIAAFHAISCGKTVSSKSAWGRDIPYLISVDSSWDCDGNKHITETVIGEDEIRERIKTVFPDTDLENGALDPTVTERTDEGCASVVELCGKVFIAGDVFAKAVGLPSSCFEVIGEGDKYTFSCKGKGHLVGMSQHGADAMARNGKSCEEILSHYFPNTELICTRPVK